MSVSNERGARADGGFSYVEVFVAVVLLGTTVVALLTLMSTTINASVDSRALSQVNTVLQNAPTV